MEMEVDNCYVDHPIFTHSTEWIFESEKASVKSLT